MMIEPMATIGVQSQKLVMVDLEVLLMVVSHRITPGQKLLAVKLSQKLHRKLKSVVTAAVRLSQKVSFKVYYQLRRKEVESLVKEKHCQILRTYL